MFKLVEYVGFDRYDDLRRLAEGATSVLAEEIRAWRSKVEVEWEAHDETGTGDAAEVELTLRLTLPTSSGVASGYLTRTDFVDPRRLRSQCRDVWGRLLDIHLDQLNERVMQYLVTAES